MIMPPIETNYLSSMRRESLHNFFDTSPTARLLRADHAPLVIDFFNRTFKTGEAISIGQLELRSLLASYQEEVHELEPELLIGPAEQYLAKWTEAGWLSRFLEASSVEPQYQLTRFAEEAIRFVDSIITRGNSLVGTESRLRLVIETLEDIVRGASADPLRRLDYLRQQRAILDAEIEAIESGKSVQVYRPAQIRERFQTAVDLLKALQSDFRAVEERFLAITRDVQQQQTSGDKTRGGILGFALDAEDLLKQQDEGISFFAFVAFLFSPTQQAALRKNIEEVLRLGALADQKESLGRVRRMVPALLAEADKVMKTTARLSSTLRRLLDAQAAAQRLRLAQVLRELKQAALELRGQAPPELGLSIATDADIASPLARTFWKPGSSFDEVDPQVHVVDLERAKQIVGEFTQLQRLDFRQLRRTIQQATYQGDSVSLGQLLKHSPVQSGVVELLGYLQIAHDDGHEIDSHIQELICIDQPRQRQQAQPGGPLTVRVPRVLFRPKANPVSRRPK